MSRPANYERRFCPSERRIARAWLIEQRSRATCAQGRMWGFQRDGIRAGIHEQRPQSPYVQDRTWGFQPDGLLVERGCSAIFAFETR